MRVICPNCKGEAHQPGDPGTVFEICSRCKGDQTEPGSYATPEPDNGLRVWPDDWPLYKQYCFSNWEDCCDMLVGPCKCGAWHQEGEFELKEDGLYRYGEKVETRALIKES